MPKKISTFQNKKWIFGHFCDFGKIKKMVKNPFLILKGGIFFWNTLIIWGDNFFCIFYTFWFNQKKWAKSKKSHFCARPIFSVFGPKMPKISIFMKKSFFLGIFLRVISVRKVFLYLWQTLIFEPARAILLRRVRYQALQMRVFGQKCQKYWFSWK